jgi:hypothetical protein
MTASSVVTSDHCQEPRASLSRFSPPVSFSDEGRASVFSSSEKKGEGATTLYPFRLGVASAAMSCSLFDHNCFFLSL